MFLSVPFIKYENQICTDQINPFLTTLKVCGIFEEVLKSDTGETKMLEFEYDSSQAEELVVHLKGNLTREEVVKVRKEIENEVLSKVPKSITINLDGTSRIDTAGVALLVVLCRLCKARDIHFRIVNPDERIRKVVRLAQLEKLLLGMGEPHGN